VALASLLSLSIHHASAESTGSIAESVGLLGVWAPDCAQAPSLNNWYVTHGLSADGDLVTTYDAGSIKRKTITENMRILSATTVAMRIRNVDPQRLMASGQSLDLIVEVKGNHTRTLRSVGANGAVLIEDGTLTKDKKPVPVLQRCGSKPTA
jgi:hypothetical protein